MPRPRQPEPQRIVQEALRHWYWIPLAVLALGAGSIALLLGNHWIGERLIAEDRALEHSASEIQTRTALAHLWIEEYVTGDRVDLAEIRDHLERSADLLGSILAAEARRPRWSLLVPAGRPGLGQLGPALRGRLEEFTRLTIAREAGYPAGEPVGVGSPADVEYDRVFHALFDDLRALDALLTARLAATEARSLLLYRSTLLAWGLIVILAVTGLWARERRRKQAEDALRESEAQLLQAQKMEAVGRLAGGIAHDINNYLAAITAQCELVRLQSEPGSVVATKMDAVLATAARSSTLVKRLLAFSRREPANPQIVDLNTVAAGLRGMITRLLGEDIRLETRLQTGLWPVRIDPSQIEQVLLNLVVNSREAMPTGGALVIATENRPAGELTDELKAQGARGDYVRLAVTDSGCGIPGDVRDKIFEPFFTTKDRASNSGLGLATVHGITTQNGGLVTVESEVGEGTVFAVLLPRSAGTAPSEAPAGEPAASARGTGSLLLVEDNDELRESLRGLLEALGYSVHAAADGIEALRRFDALERPPDLLVTDVVMPGMSGRELVERLQQLHADLKVLYISGHTDGVILRHGVDAGTPELLAKPFTSAALAEKLRQLLDR